MRIPKRGEKGFTLIELLIVVAILGVLAAVVIPNVGQFFGKGQEEARRTEFHNVASAVIAMMVDNGIARIPNPIDYAGGTATNNMSAFPDDTSDNTDGDDPDSLPDKKTDPEGYAYDFNTDTKGYLLYGHDITGSGTPANPNQVDVNYLNIVKTTYYYTCEADGTVRQWNEDMTIEYTD